MAVRPEEGACPTEVYYLEIIKDFIRRSCVSGLTLFYMCGAPVPWTVFLSKPVHMPVIPNLADSCAESRVNGNQVKAFPALTGKCLTIQTLWLAQMRDLTLSPSCTATIVFPEQVKPLVLTHLITKVFSSNISQNLLKQADLIFVS